MNISPHSRIGHHRPEPSQIFKKADTDGNGTIDKDEPSSLLTKNAPTDVSGATQGTAPNADDMFKKLDSDGDGPITLSEFKNGMESMRAQGRHNPGGGVADLSGSTDTIKKLLAAFKSALDEVMKSEATPASSSAEASTPASSTGTPSPNLSWATVPFATDTSSPGALVHSATTRTSLSSPKLLQRRRR